MYNVPYFLFLQPLKDFHFKIEFAQMDEVISQAQTTRAVLGSQRAMFGDVQGKVKQLGEKFPIVRGLIGIL